MKRFTFVFIVFILVVSIFFIIMQADIPENSTVTVMQKAFDTTGAKLVSSEVYMRARLAAESFENANERQQLLIEAIIGTGGNIEKVKPVFNSIDNDISFGTETDYIINDTLSIHCGILKGRNEGAAAEYQMTISLTDTSQKQELEALTAGLSDTLKKYGIKPSVNICIIGSLDGNVKDSELETICENIFESARANEVEGMRDKGLISVSAFSPSISDTVRVNGKRVNLNVAVRYNSYEGKTYIWLATPVITTEY